MQTVVYIEENPGELTCYLLVGSESEQNITWTWAIKNTILNADDRLSFKSNNTQSRIKFERLRTTDSSFYSCMAANDFSSFSRTIELRVKSKITNLILKFLRLHF